MNEEYKIKIIESPSIEFCNKLSEQQKIVWGIADIEIIPPWKIFITPKIGGLLIAAFDHKNPVAHAIFTHAHENLKTKPYLYLDLIGVLPEYQNHKIAEKIILKALEFAKSNGYTSIQWTYDPLEGANANVYIRKLGAIVTKFLPGYYGELTGKRQRGLKTDRFLVKLETKIQPKEHKKIDITITQQEYNQYEALIMQNPNSVAIEFPADLNTILSENAERAQNIRRLTGIIFDDLLHKGYCINGFMKNEGNNYYVAEKIKA